MKKLLFIMNPYAGTRKANRYLADIIAIFNRAGYDVLTYMTAGPGDCITAVTQKAAGMDLIVCAGGDGSLNPNSTYRNYQWILTRSSGRWELQTWGYG